jgi:hypothetical protein
MSDEAWRDPEKGPADNEVAFDYIKGPHFSTVWADGALASGTPNGLVHVAWYAERPALPRRQVYKIDPETGSLGEEVKEKLISRGSVVREMPFDVLMTVETAEGLSQLLQRVLKDLNDQENGVGKK